MYLHLRNGRIDPYDYLEEDHEKHDLYFPIRAFCVSFLPVLSFVPKDKTSDCFMLPIDGLFLYDGIYYGQFDVLEVLPDDATESVYDHDKANGNDQ